MDKGSPVVDNPAQTVYLMLLVQNNIFSFIIHLFSIKVFYQPGLSQASKQFFFADSQQVFLGPSQTKIATVTVFSELQTVILSIASNIAYMSVLHWRADESSQVCPVRGEQRGHGCVTKLPRRAASRRHARGDVEIWRCLVM